MALMHRLALVFRRPVAELDIDADELVHWIAYEKHHPFPDTVLEFMLGQLTAVVAGMMSKQQPKPGDFMLSEIMKGGAEKPQTFEDQVRAAFAMIGKSK